MTAARGYLNAAHLGHGSSDGVAGPSIEEGPWRLAKGQPWPQRHVRDDLAAR